MRISNLNSFLINYGGYLADPGKGSLNGNRTLRLLKDPVLRKSVDHDMHLHRVFQLLMKNKKQNGYLVQLGDNWTTKILVFVIMLRNTIQITTYFVTFTLLEISFLDFLRFRDD